MLRSRRRLHFSDFILLAFRSCDRAFTIFFNGGQTTKSRRLAAQSPRQKILVRNGLGSSQASQDHRLLATLRATCVARVACRVCGPCTFVPAGHSNKTPGLVSRDSRPSCDIIFCSRPLRGRCICKLRQRSQNVMRFSRLKRAEELWACDPLVTARDGQKDSRPPAKVGPATMMQWTLEGPPRLSTSPCGCGRWGSYDNAAHRANPLIQVCFAHARKKAPKADVALEAE